MPDQDFGLLPDTGREIDVADAIAIRSSETVRTEVAGLDSRCHRKRQQCKMTQLVIRFRLRNLRAGCPPVVWAHAVPW
jgi:hypothetical protein